jgi:hypothetical protein
LKSNSPPLDRLGAAAHLASVILLTFASITLRNPAALPLTLLLWGAGVLLPLMALPRAAAGTVPSHRWAVLVAIALLVAAIAARTWRLDQIPAYLHGDAAVVALESIAVREVDHRGFVAPPGGPSTDYSFGWFWLPNSCFFLQGIGIDLFGEDLAGFRVGSVILGVAGLTGHAVFTWSSLGPTAALLSLIPLTTYHWHLFVSRSGHAYGQASFFAAWAFGLYALGRRRNSSRWLYLCGVFCGLPLLSVFAARIVPVILVALAVTEAVHERGHRRDLVRRFGCVAWGGATAIAPALPGILANWSAYVGRTRDVFIWSEEGRPHVSSVVGADGLHEIVWSQLWSSLRVFLGGADASLQYGFRGRFMDPFLIGFAVVGMLVCLRRWPSARYRLPLLWFFPTLLLGAVITIDAPSMSRLAPIVTVPYLFAAIGMASSLEIVRREYGRRWTGALSVLLVVLCLSAAWWNFDQFFKVYPEQRPADTVTRLGQLLGREDPAVEVRLLLGEGGAHTPLYWDHGTLRFFNRHRAGKDVVDLGPELETDSPRRAFVLFSDRHDQLEQLHAAFPGGEVVAPDALPGLVLFRTPGSAP